jgi:hypothetical protein
VRDVSIPLVLEFFPQGRQPHALPLHCHLDNCRVHFSKASEKWFAKNDIIGLRHTPYRRDLAPSDFSFFGHLKTDMARQMFNEPEDLLDGINVFQGWVERVRWV